MPTTTNPGDFGIIFSGTTGTPGTYIDVNGQTQTQVQIVAVPVRMPAFVETAYVHAGKASRFTLMVDVVVNAGNLDLKLQGHQDLDPSAAWADLWMFADYDPATITTARNFATTGRFILQTSNMGAVVEACLLVSPLSAFAGSITVRLQVEV